MQNFTHKHIAILGLSTEGRDAAKFFSKRHIAFSCFDRRSRDELGEVYEELSHYTSSFYLGVDYLDYLSDVDIIVRTPGMFLHDPRLIELRNKGITITSVTQLMFDLCTTPIIGVTGTKGKGTTSTLIYSMLQQSGLNVRLGGNVGTPLLSQIDEVNKDDWVVLELSSFQLEDLTKSPHVAVVLRITSDHLRNFDPLASNFHVDRTAYINAKKPIVAYQHPDDVAILNADDKTSASFEKETEAKEYYFSKTDPSATAYVDNNHVVVKWKNKTYEICRKDDILLRGVHNLENIAAASIASLASGAAIGDIQHVARTFKGLEHRLEEVRKVNGVVYVNDTFSTVPETTIAAMWSYDNPIILIVGGSEKGSDFTYLGKEIVKRNVKALIIIGQMTQRILSAVKNAHYHGSIITGCRTMHDVVLTARKHAEPGDVVLLSPACASFDMFKNYKERGTLFKHEIRSL